MNQKTLIITRVFNAAPDIVWKAWTEEKFIKQWWGPDRFTCPSAKIDLREGGTSVVCMRAPAEFRVTGNVLNLAYLSMC